VVLRIVAALTCGHPEAATDMPTVALKNAIIMQSMRKLDEFAGNLCDALSEQEDKWYLTTLMPAPDEGIQVSHTARRW
jgi:hypothetical protein